MRPNGSVTTCTGDPVRRHAADGTVPALEGHLGIRAAPATPVVASIDARPASLGTFQYVERYLGLSDRLGVDLAGVLDDLSEDATADGGSSGQVAERGAEAIGRAVRDVADGRAPRR